VVHVSKRSEVFAEHSQAIGLSEKVEIFAEHSQAIGLSKKVERAALGEINLVVSHNGVTGSGRSTYFQLFCKERCKKLLSTAELNKDTMFAITVQTMVRYPRKDGDLAAGERC
jgi:hypothetical protein